MITVDFETYYSKDFSLSKLSTEAYIRDPRFHVIGVGVKVDDGPVEWVTGGEVKPYLHSLDLPNRYLLCHHAAFDGAILAWKYGILPKYYLDTLSMSRPVTGQTVGGSLAKLATYFNLGVKGTEVVKALGKRLIDFDPDELHAYGEYCRNDVQLTYDLYHKLLPYTTPQEQYIIDMVIRMYTDPVLQLDSMQLQSHLVRTQFKKQVLLDRLQGVHKDLLMSNPKFAEVLASFGVDPPKKISAKTGKETWAFSKSDEGFKALLEHEDERVQALVAARLGVKSTLEETRTQKFIEIAGRGSLPIMLNYYRAHTGRMSGGDGANPQNLTRGSPLRYSMIAPPKHVVIAGDSAQIEARLLAWFSGEFDLVSDFRTGEDIYSKFASSVYDEPVSKAQPDRRFLGKTCILGLGYMTGAKKLQTTLKLGKTPVVINEKEAKRIVDLYRSSFPMICNLWSLADKALQNMANGWEGELGVHLKLPYNRDGIKLPNGMMLRYPNLRATSDGLVYDSGRGATTIYGGKCVENIIQALARIVVFTQTAKLDQWLRKRDGLQEQRFKLVHSVHDEMVAVAPASHADEVKNYMVQVMSTPPKWCESLPVSCEVHYGPSYGDCK